MRVEDSVEKVPVLLAIGVTGDGRRTVLGLQAGDKESASNWREFFKQFKAKWEKGVPSAVKCLENALDACLTYLHFPEEEWICLRTTNVIERVNKEFKRRTKPMEILAGERSCYLLLAFVCLKMEMSWRSKPIGKVPQNLPFLKRLAEETFTQ